MNNLNFNFISKRCRFSSDQYSPSRGDTKSKLEIVLPGNAPEFRRVAGAQILYIEMPHVFYNVTALRNRFVAYNSAGDTKLIDVTITPGFYDLTALENALTAAAPTTVALAKDPLTGRVTATFGILDIGISSDYDTNPIAAMLGFGQQPGTVTTALDGILAAPYMPRMGGPHTVNLHSRTISSGFMYGADGKGDAYLVAPVQLGEFGLTSVFRPSADTAHTFTYDTPRKWDTIDFEVRDNHGDLVDMQDRDWTLFLQVYYYQ